MRKHPRYLFVVITLFFCQYASGQVVLDSAATPPILQQGSGGVLLDQFTSTNVPNLADTPPDRTINTRIIDSVSARGQRFDLSSVGMTGDSFEITGFRLLASGNNTSDVADDTLEFAVYTGDVSTVTAPPVGTVYSITSSEIASFGTGVSLIGSEVFSLASLANGTNDGDFVTATFTTPISVSASQANDLTFFAFSDAQGVGTNDDFEHLEGIFNGEGRLNFRAEGIFESGAGTGSRNFNFQVLGNTVPVPEPSSLVVLSLLCAGLLGKRRRHVANTSVGL